MSWKGIEVCNPNILVFEDLAELAGIPCSYRNRVMGVRRELISQRAVIPCPNSCLPISPFRTFACKQFSDSQQAKFIRTPAPYKYRILQAPISHQDSISCTLARPASLWSDTTITSNTHVEKNHQNLSVELVDQLGRISSKESRDAVALTSWEICLTSTWLHTLCFSPTLFAVIFMHITFSWRLEHHVYQGALQVFVNANKWSCEVQLLIDWVDFP